MAAKKATKKPTGKKPGRPRTHDRADIGRDLCARVAEGELVKDVLASLKLTRGQVFVWTLEDAEFRDAYARARESQAHAMAEQVIALADNEELPAESRRVRVDARKWLTSKIAPRAYGEKLTTEHTGEVKHEHRGTLRWGDVEIPL